VQCNGTTATTNDFLLPETGNMVGPTSQGVSALIAEDPGAEWNDTLNCAVEGTGTTCLASSNGQVPAPAGTSPRIGAIPLYNPAVYANGQQSGKSQPQLQVVGFLGFFIEGVDGSGNVTGRITPIMLQNNPNGPSTGSFAKIIRLVQ
jgi:hypothetical protein